MTGVPYVGALVTANPEVVYRDYVTGIKAADLSTGAIDDIINAGLGSYATTTYADTGDAALATQSYIDGQDNLRIKTAIKDAVNGVAGLDASGKISPNRIDAPNTQLYFKGPYSPTTYGSGSGLANETTLYSFNTADPGYPYKLLVFGELDTHTNNSAEYALVNVRAGSATGEIIARGQGASDVQENVLAGDDFNRSSNNTSLGAPSDWEQTYTNPGNGALGISSGNVNAAWIDGQFGNSGDNSCIARRINPLDMRTGTNFQRITATIGGYIGDNRTNSSDYFGLRFYLRMNDTRTSYLAWEMTDQDVRLVYANGGSEAALGSTVSMTKPASNTPLYCFAGNAAGEARKFYFYKDTTLISQIEDTSAVTALGPSNRGWGFGMRAPQRLGVEQTTPPNLDNIFISEAVPNYNPTLIIPFGLNTATVRTGATTLFVRAFRSGANAGVSSSVSTYRPKLHCMAIPA